MQASQAVTHHGRCSERGDCYFEYSPSGLLLDPGCIEL